MKTFLKIAVGLVLTIIVLLGGATMLLNTPRFQQRLLVEATKLLSDHFSTKVTVDSVSVNLFTQRLSLHGISVDDQQGRQMLNLERLAVSLNLNGLRQRDIIVDEVETEHLRATLLKEKTDSVPNFQFLIDAFRKKPRQDSLKTTKAKKLHLALEELQQRDVSIFYNKDGKLYEVSFKELVVDESWGERKVNVDSLRWHTDYHRPRKNAGKKHRGFFDPGHFDIIANLKGSFRLIGKDSLQATLKESNFRDPKTGIDLRDVHFKLEANRKTARLTDVTVRQTNTTLMTRRADILLPSKKEGRTLAFNTDTIHGKAMLCDIARVFAPALKNFRIPLRVTTLMSGKNHSITFRHARVRSADNHLQISATGHLDHLKGKHKAVITFDIHRMYARSGMAEKVINQFAVKKLMMNQLHRLGDLHYKGSFRIVYRHLGFRGRLTSVPGFLDFNFGLDGNTKYVSGHVSSTDFKLGDAFDVKDLGPVTGHADFRVDISKPRTKKMRQEKGGKLPIGTVDAFVDDCSYKGIHLHNLTANIKSDGAEALGNVEGRGHIFDYFSQFSYVSTKEMQKLKVIKPGFRLHRKEKKTEEEKLKEKEEKMKAKMERKEQKETEREEKQKVKQEQKELQKQQKEQKRLEKAEQKQLKKQQKESNNKSAEESQ